MYFVGIDLGTTSVKLILVDEHGKIFNSSVQEYPLQRIRDGWSEQNPEDWWMATLRGFSELVANLDASVEAISFSGQMHGLVLLDERDEVIRPALLWNDQRTGRECDFLNESIGRKALSGLTANIALTGFTAPKVVWVKNHEPENFKRITKIMLPKDFLAYRFSGVFATDCSDASGTLYFDVQHRKWSQEMLDTLGISKEQLPVVYESYQKIGKMKPEVAQLIGVQGLPSVIIGGGDQAVGAVGTGTVEDQSCSISLGTSGVVFAANDVFLVDPENALHSFAHANGRYHWMGVVLSAGGSVQWFMENVLQWDDYLSAFNAVRETAIAEGLYFLPYITGERTPVNDPHAKGVFLGLSSIHDRIDMLRAVMEGVCFALRDSFEIMRTNGISITEARVTGGGAKSEIWCQMLSDILNIEIQTILSEEGPAYGAAILAMTGSGLYPTVDAACEKLIKVKDRRHPDKEKNAIYNRKYSTYKKIYPAVRRLFKEPLMEEKWAILP